MGLRNMASKCSLKNGRNHYSLVTQSTDCASISKINMFLPRTEECFTFQWTFLNVSYRLQSFWVMTLKSAFPVLRMCFPVKLMFGWWVYNSHMQFLNKCSHCGQYFKSSILSAEVDCFSWSAGNKNILRSCSDLPG